MPPLVRSILNVAYLLALFLGAVAFALAPTGHALANGAHVGSQEVFSGRVGPYAVTVLTIPVTGAMHLSINVSELGRATPVTDATVQVSATGLQGNSQALGPADAPAAFGALGWYGVTLPIEEAGAWTFTLAVQGAQGEGRAQFVVDVQRSGGVNWLLLVEVAVALAILGWIVFLLRPRTRGPGRTTR